ncbi:MAG: ion channel [Desulfatiglandaceae bacterium]
MTEKRVPWLTQHKFLLLFISLLLFALLQPHIAGLKLIGASTLLKIFFTAILFSSLYAISEHRRFFILTSILAVPVFGLQWATYFLGQSTGLMVGIHSLTALFLILVAGIIISYALKGEAVTAEKINAAICAYLFIGLICAYLYSVIYTLQPGSFQIENPDLSRFVYYSFITLSTLGYGDITPLTPQAQSLAYVEAIAGQIYLTVLVARLVGLHIAHNQLNRSGNRTR